MRWRIGDRAFWWDATGNLVPLVCAQRRLAGWILFDYADGSSKDIRARGSTAFPASPTVGPPHRLSRTLSDALIDRLRRIRWDEAEEAAGREWVEHGDEFTARAAKYYQKRIDAIEACFDYVARYGRAAMVEALLPSIESVCDQAGTSMAETVRAELLEIFEIFE